LLAAVYAATRLAVLWRFPPFIDESAYAMWAQRVHDGVNDRFVALAYGKLPLPSWLGSAFVFAGIEPLAAVRLVSFFAGLGSLVLAAVLAGRLGGRYAAIAAAALWIILPLTFVHDVIGVFEPLVTVLLALSLYLQIRLAERPTYGIALLLGLAMGAGLLTKETGLVALLLFPASLIVFDWRRDGLTRRLVTWAGYALTALALTGVIYLVLTLSELWDDYATARDSLGASRGLGAGLSHPLRWFNAVWPGYRTELLGFLTIPIILVIIAGIVVAVLRFRRLALLYLLWIVAPLVIVVLFLANPFSRYLVPVAPLLTVFGGYALALGAAALRERVRMPDRRRVVAAAAAVVVVILAAIFDVRVLVNPDTAPYPGLAREEYASGWAAGTGFDGLADELRGRAAGRPILIAWFAGYTEALPLLLRHDPEIQVVRADPGKTGPAATSDYVVQNGWPPPADHGFGELQPVWTYRRPDNGTPLVLLERGVRWQDRFYATPEELRAGLGLPDRDFDRFIAANPDIGAWYVARSSR
jgi:4-amino-4-deoxy-L-arabinose transferase-like glycosyltransferase